MECRRQENSKSITPNDVILVLNKKVKPRTPCTLRFLVFVFALVSKQGYCASHFGQQNTMLCHVTNLEPIQQEESSVVWMFCLEEPEGIQFFSFPLNYISCCQEV